MCWTAGAIAGATPEAHERGQAVTYCTNVGNAATMPSKRTYDEGSGIWGSRSRVKVI